MTFFSHATSPWQSLRSLFIYWDTRSRELTVITADEATDKLIKRDSKTSSNIKEVQFIHIKKQLQPSVLHLHTYSASNNLSARASLQQYIFLSLMAITRSTKNILWDLSNSCFQEKSRVSNHNVNKAEMSAMLHIHRL